MTGDETTPERQEEGAGPKLERTHTRIDPSWISVIVSALLLGAYLWRHRDVLRVLRKSFWPW
jgi:hypothetical protein